MDSKQNGAAALASNVIELRPGLADFLQTAEGRTLSDKEHAAMLIVERAMPGNNPPEERWVHALAAVRDMALGAPPPVVAHLNDALDGVRDSLSIALHMRSAEERDACFGAARWALADARAALLRLERLLKQRHRRSARDGLRRADRWLPPRAGRVL